MRPRYNVLTGLFLTLIMMNKAWGVTEVGSPTPVQELEQAVAALDS